MVGRFYKEVGLLFLVFCLVFLTISCSRKTEKKKPLSFEICKETELPDELLTLIEKKKGEPFSFTYENSAHLYLAVGYGVQPEGEYVAAVRSLSETESVIYADTILISLTHAKNLDTGVPSSYPYVVLRCEKKKKPVIFL